MDRYNDLKVYKVVDGHIHHYIDYHWFGAVRQHFDLYGEDVFGGGVYPGFKGVSLDICVPSDLLTITMEDPLTIPPGAQEIEKGIYKTTKSMREWADWSGKPSFLTSTVWSSDDK